MHDSQTRFTLLTMRLLNGIQRMLCLCLINFATLCHHDKIHKLIKMSYYDVSLMKNIYR